MLLNYVPAFIVVVVVGLLAPVILRLSKVVRRQIPASEGEARNDARPDRYFAVVASFVVFAAAMVFLLPWAFSFMALGLAGLVEMLVFLGILAAAYLWIWKKGVLEWL
jgi:NADH:ubiquinone oxidoreductase subunit 3 (subunit A)